MLCDEGSAVDADYLVMWECLAKLFLGLLVCCFVAIGGHEHSSVYDEEVGVGGR